MQWFDWMIIIVAIAALIIAGYALYRSYHLTADDFLEVA
jgi:hypothetical protein